MTRSRVQLGLALAATATLGTLSTGLATAAVATPPAGHGATPHGHGASPHGAAGHANQGHHATPTASSPGRGHGRGHGSAQGSAHGQGQSVSGHNPPGNNGTVKIAGPADAVGHPSNNPHPGCRLYVEWFGFDRGSDVVSTVTFTPQAPTRDVAIGGTAPSTVFVGGDDAGGGTDLDGRQQYSLSFTGGAAQPKQGYHVKVTVSTPHSLGNDTKTKVFWVRPCAAAADSTSTTTTGTAAGDAVTAGAEVAPVSQGASSIYATAPDRAVKGTVASRPAASGVAVPTAVDAGEGGGTLADLTRSPLPLALLGAGAVVAGAAVVRRKRADA